VYKRSPGSAQLIEWYIGGAAHLSEERSVFKVAELMRTRGESWALGKEWDRHCDSCTAVEHVGELCCSCVCVLGGEEEGGELAQTWPSAVAAGPEPNRAKRLASGAMHSDLALLEGRFSFCVLAGADKRDQTAPLGPGGVPSRSRRKLPRTRCSAAVQPRNTNAPYCAFRCPQTVALPAPLGTGAYLAASLRTSSLVLLKSASNAESNSTWAWVGGP